VLPRLSIGIAVGSCFKVNSFTGEDCDFRREQHNMAAESNKLDLRFIVFSLIHFIKGQVLETDI
jgi:hypothetical protein